MSTSADNVHARGIISLAALREKINEGEIDTIIVAVPDTNGRLVGKRVTGSFFLDHCLEAGTHGCNYLLTVNIEMDPLEGFKLASWEQGYGDFAMKPDLATLRLLPWQTTSAMVICDLHHEDGALVDEAPRAVLRTQIHRRAAQGF